MKNIEIKAICKYPEKMHSILLDSGADFRGIDHQIDTYFNVDHGRLKLREGNIENALIAYTRPNTAKSKQSDFQLYRNQDLKDLKPLLLKKSWKASSG